MIIKTTALVAFTVGILAGVGATTVDQEEEVHTTYCSGSKIERVEVPVGDERLLQELLDCRSDLAKVSEENNCCINCIEQECE